MSEPKPERPIAQRIEELHGWYCRSVLDIKLLPEVQRLWLDFFRQGFNGPELALVIRYLRRQISLGKRNDGALKLTNLCERGEDGSFVRLAEDLALAKQWQAGTRPKLAPLPEGEMPTPQANPEIPQAIQPNQIDEETKRRHLAVLSQLLGKTP